MSKGQGLGEQQGEGGVGKEEEEGEKSPVKTGLAAASGLLERSGFPAGRARVEAAGYRRGAEPWHARCMPQPHSRSTGSRAWPRCHLPGFVLPAGPRAEGGSLMANKD